MPRSGNQRKKNVRLNSPSFLSSCPSLSPTPPPPPPPPPPPTPAAVRLCWNEAGVRQLPVVLLQRTRTDGRRHRVFMLACRRCVVYLVIMACILAHQIGQVRAFASHANAKRVLVVGGGASGVFAAIEILEGSKRPVHVTILEATSTPLNKVLISGGGRCNLLPDTLGLLSLRPLRTVLPQKYPRGHAELLGPLSKRFTPLDAHDWFSRRGLHMVTEEDGRTFPASGKSQDVADVLLKALREASDPASGKTYELKTRTKVASIAPPNGPSSSPSSSSPSSSLPSSPLLPSFFSVTISSPSERASPPVSAAPVSPTQSFDAVVLATGSVRSSFALFQKLGHGLVPPVPSLFQLTLSDCSSPSDVFYDLAGVTLPDVSLSVRPSSDGGCPPPPSSSGLSPSSFRGPAVVTHGGVSGPAALQLSAHYARRLHGVDYKTGLAINFVPGFEGAEKEVAKTLTAWIRTGDNGRRLVLGPTPSCFSSSESSSSSSSSSSQPLIPRRVWEAVARRSLESSSSSSPSSSSPLRPSPTTFNALSSSDISRLSSLLVSFPLTLVGKSPFKEEFVTAGGVPNEEVDFRRMESRKTPGLFFCGEVVDVDAVTGGWNFLNCWTTGFLAAKGVVARLEAQAQVNADNVPRSARPS